MSETREQIAADPHLRCPKCLTKMDQITYQQIPIERCPDCHGIWLDAGELELIQQRDRAQDGWFNKLLKKLAAQDKTPKKAAGSESTTSSTS